MKIKENVEHSFEIEFFWMICTRLYKALRDYNETHKILHIKKVLDHRWTSTTQRYVELHEELHSSTSREIICEIAFENSRSKKLLKKCFEHKTGQYDYGGKVFYKHSNQQKIKVDAYLLTCESF